MTKKDLQAGMIVELFNGDKCLVLDTDKGKILVDDSTYLMLNDYDNNLNITTADNDLLLKFSIKKIFKIHWNNCLNTLFEENNLRLIWERKYISERKISKDEIRKAFNIKPYENITIID